MNMEKITYEKFEKTVKDILIMYPNEIEVIVMTDEFYEHLLSETNLNTMQEMRRILSVPICVVENKTIKQFMMSTGKTIEMDYKVIGPRIKY